MLLQFFKIIQVNSIKPHPNSVELTKLQVNLLDHTGLNCPKLFEINPFKSVCWATLITMPVSLLYWSPAGPWHLPPLVPSLIRLDFAFPKQLNKVLSLCLTKKTVNLCGCIFLVSFTEALKGVSWSQQFWELDLCATYIVDLVKTPHPQHCFHLYILYYLNHLCES